MYYRVLTRLLPFVYFVFGLSFLSSISLIEVSKTLLFVLYVPLIIKHLHVFRRNISFILLLLYSSFFILSSFFSINKGSNLFSYVLYFNILMFPVGVIAIEFTREHFKYLIYGFCVGAVIQFIVIIYQTLHGVPRPSGTLNTVSQFSSVGVVVLFLFVYLVFILKSEFLQHNLRFHKSATYLIPLVFMLFTFVSVILSKTRGAIISVTVSLFIFTLIYTLMVNKRLGFFGLFGLVIFLVGLYMFFYLFFPSVSSKLDSIFVYANSYEGHCRFDIYRNSLNLIKDSIFVGHGPFTFYFSNNGCNPAYHSHNNYLEVAYASGLPALLFLMLIDLYSTFVLVKALFNNHLLIRYRVLSLVLLSSYTAYFIYGMTDLTLYNSTASPLIFFGIGVISNLHSLWSGQQKS